MIATKPKTVSGVAASTATEVTTGAAARLLNISQDTVSRLCEKGALRARRVPPHGWWRIHRKSLVKYGSKLRN
jgi:excisionase family DNA binding protein